MAPRLSITHIPANRLVICYHLKYSTSCAIRILISDSTDLSKLVNILENCLLWAREDLNLRLPRYQRGTLNQLSYLPICPDGETRTLKDFSTGS
mgnify:CR=1 FL=1